MEIVQICQKLTFDGSIEHLKCITKHGDFSAINDQENGASSGRAIVERQKLKRLSSSRWAD